MSKLSRNANNEQLIVECTFKDCNKRFLSENGMKVHLSAVHKVRGKKRPNLRTRFIAEDAPCY